MFLLVLLALLPIEKFDEKEADILVALYESKHETNKLLEAKCKIRADYLNHKAAIVEHLTLNHATAKREARELRHEADIAQLDYAIAKTATIQSGLLLDYARILRVNRKSIPVPDDHGPEQ